MLKLARELDMLTIGYAFNADDTRRLMQEAAPDIFIFHAGITGGGSTGDADCRLARRHRQAERAPLRHRAKDQARRDPARPRRRDRRARARARTCSTTPSCDGVQLGSSIERMAIERPIEARTAAFKAAKPARAR